MHAKLMVVAVAVVACGPGLKPVDTRLVGRDVLAQVVRDADRLAELMRNTVTNGGLWFDDPACTQQFGAGGEITGDRIPAFARCVAALNLETSAREDQLGDVVVLKHAPGIELEARVIRRAEGLHLIWIGFASRRSGDPDVPTITHDALEALRLNGDRNGPLDASAAAGLGDDDRTWVKVCFDPSGAVTDAFAYETTSTAASKAFVAAARRWRFRPFTIRARPIAACAMVLMVHPANNRPAVETLPLPPPPSRGKREVVVLAGSRLVEGRRIAGDRNVVPDDLTKHEIQEQRLTRVEGSYRICLDESGNPESVLPLRSTGFAAYDAKIMARMRTWRYSPYQVDDQPVPVCTKVTFIYKQARGAVRVQRH